MIDNRNDLKVLIYLYQSEIDTVVKARKASTIAKNEDVNLSSPKVRQSLNDFKNLGYVGNGIKEGKAETYYITDKGIKFIEEIL